MALNSASQERPASSSSQLFMDFESNVDLQQQIKNAAANLEISTTPDTFSQTLTGIKLNGAVPLSIQPGLGNNFSLAEILTEKQIDQPEAKVTVTLASPQARRAVEIFSDDNVVEYGANKNFLVRSHLDKRPIGRMPYETLAYLLDNLIPTTDTGELSKLAEARFALPFDDIAVRTGDVLARRAKKGLRVRKYIAHSLFGGEAFHRDGQLDMMADRFTVELAGPVTKYTLETFESLPIGGGYIGGGFDASNSAFREVPEGKVVKNVRYSFAESNYREKAGRRSQKNLNAEIGVTLLSHDFAKPVLDGLIQGAQEDFDGTRIMSRILGSILDSRTQLDPS